MNSAFLCAVAMLPAFGPASDERAPIGGAQEGASLEPVRDSGLIEASAPERAAREALDAGLRYLARRQAETVDGSFPREARGEAREWAPVGIASLGALAFMAAGNSPGRGPYGNQLERSIGYLLDMTDLTPESPHFGYISNQGDRISRTHGHGYSTLALAQAHGMSPRKSERLQRALTAAVRLIEKSQGAEGGWYYEPDISANHEGSVTICYAQALRAARNSGIQVDGAVVRRAEDYVVRLQKADGTFRYQLDREDSTVALTAAGIATLNSAGRYDDATIQNGIDAIWSRLGLRDAKEIDRFPFYERLYMAQAFWQLSDRSHFERWFQAERKRIVSEQKTDGSWTDRRYGSCYATAVNCLVLALPEGLLPIFQR